MSNIENKPFRDYGKGSQDDNVVIPTKWNDEEQEMLIKGMIALRQTKKGTTIKQLAKIGLAKVVSEQEMLETVAENHRKNTRLGLADLEKSIRQSFKKDGKLNKSNTFADDL